MTSTTATDPSAAQGPEDLPDLGRVIASEEAAEAARAVLAEFEQAEGGYHVGSLTDEELVICTGSPEGAQPMGEWYPGLGEHPQRIARATAYRSLTSREEVMVTMREEELDVMVSQRLMGLLRLRHEPALFTAQAMSRQGPAWYVLRRCEGAWLREVVTGHGLHTHDLVRLDDEEELFLRGFTMLLDHNTASGVSGLRQPGGGAAAPGDVVSFLTRQTHVTQVAMVHPGSDAAAAMVLCVDGDGTTTLGTMEGDGVVYAGAEPDTFLREWRAWRDRW